MRTTAPVWVVFAIGIAGLMLGMSGFSAAWGAPAPQTQAAQDEVNNANESVNPQEGPVSGPISSEDSSTVGLIASGLGTLTNIAGAVAIFPLAMMNLGFPAWFAIPLGGGAQALVGIGLIEFAVNREWT